MSFAFAKFHGFGNDYIVIERQSLPSADLSELAKAICNRHMGVGGDGIAVIEKLDEDRADFFCEIVNPDGSIAGFSGNGTRCAVAYLHHAGIWGESQLRLATRSGVKTYDLIERNGNGEFWFEAEIGKPLFASDAIPVLTRHSQGAVVNELIIIDGVPHTFSAVNVGNPVACVFVETFEFDWRTLGRSLEMHAAFPERTNVVFVKIRDRENIDIRIWERAAGETSSSGTCSSAAAVLAAFTLRTGRTLNVHAPGGMTQVIWRDDDEVVISGRADFAFIGEWPC